MSTPGVVKHSPQRSPTKELPTMMQEEAEEEKPLACDVRDRGDRGSQDRGVAALVGMAQEMNPGFRFLSGERVRAWCERAACNHPLNVRPWVLAVICLLPRSTRKTLQSGLMYAFVSNYRRRTMPRGRLCTFGRYWLLP